MRDRGRIVLVVLAAASVLLVAVWQGQRAWEHARVFRPATTSSPTLSPLFSRAVVQLGKGEEACLAPVTYYPETARGRFRMHAPRAPGPRLAFEASGPGYRATGVTDRLPVRVEGTVDFEFREPRREVTGRFCWRNRGPTPIDLIGTNEGRSLTPVELTVDGKPRKDQELELVLFKRGGHSLRSRRAELIDRAASLTGGLAPEWLLWPVMLLVFGSPLVVAAAFAMAVWRSPRP